MNLTRPQLEQMTDAERDAVVSKVLFDGKDQIGIGMPPDYLNSWAAMGKVIKVVSVKNIKVLIENNTASLWCIQVGRSIDGFVEFNDIPRAVYIASVLAVQEVGNKT